MNTLKLHTFVSSIILGIILMTTSEIYAQMTVTYRPAVYKADARENTFEQEILELFLEKTRDEYGDYELKRSPEMNYDRALEELRRGRFENFIVHTSARNELVEEFDYLQVPIARGIFGYRVFLTNPEVAAQLADVQTVDELRQFTMGQGTGWTDVDILRANGFEVTEINSFASLFKMVAANRFNLFPRGANEVEEELELNSDVDNLVLDSNICLYYPLPRFLFTTKGNNLLLERLKAGFDEAYADGSFQKIWEKHLMESVRFAELEKRKIFRINNPMIEAIDYSKLEPYIYNPIKE